MKSSSSFAGSTSTTRRPGEVRSSSTDDIACWFIDTDYDKESFFVRHAYFTGDDDPYERLRKASGGDRRDDLAEPLLDGVTAVPDLHRQARSP